MATQTSATPAQVRAAAKQWFERQLALLQRQHGSRWPEHEQWLRDYLAQQLRSRLVERGWRLRR